MQPLPSHEEGRPEAGESPESRAGLLSFLTFSWLTPLLAEGFKAPLEKHQVPGLIAADKVASINQDFDRWDAGQTLRERERAGWREEGTTGRAGQGTLAERGALNAC